MACFNVQTYISITQIYAWLPDVFIQADMPNSIQTPVTDLTNKILTDCKQDETSLLNLQGQSFVLFRTFLSF